MLRAKACDLLRSFGTPVLGGERVEGACETQTRTSVAFLLAKDAWRGSANAPFYVLKTTLNHHYVLNQIHDGALYERTFVACYHQVIPLSTCLIHCHAYLCNWSAIHREQLPRE